MNAQSVGRNEVTKANICHAQLRFPSVLRFPKVPNVILRSSETTGVLLPSVRSI